ncbi:YqjF family protein [Mycobacterium seoulense]|uniref:YqjF family protein n=1 Tax=Mycobacterium seoulense TaxID=386911 RepID=UPI003CF6EDFA
MTASPGPPVAEPDGGDGLTGYPVTPPPLRGPVTFDQRWRDLTFIHWPVRPDTVEEMYPPGTRPDTFADGMTYVGLVPFVMDSTKVGSSLRLPYFGSFAETNVRLYSVDDSGRHGVLFRSLETARLAVVPIVRAGLGVPYTWARMRTHRLGDRVTYDSVRRWPRRGLHSRVEVAVGAPVEPTPLEVWLTARWGAHTRKAGRTWWIPNEHEAWPLRAADIVELDDELVAAAMVRPAGERLRALFSPGVRTRFGRPTRVS